MHARSPKLLEDIRDAAAFIEEVTQGRTLARDKASLDVFWLHDETLADSDNLPPPDVIAQEIVDDLEAALEQFRLIAGDLTAAS